MDAVRSVSTSNPYGYKLGERVDISDKYFRSAVELAKDASNAAREAI